HRGRNRETARTPPPGQATCARVARRMTMPMASSPTTPSIPKQPTLAREARVQGLGLFTAKSATATIRPAEPDSGVVFRRTDLPGTPTTGARIENVVDRPRRTALRATGAPADSTEALVETV